MANRTETAKAIVDVDGKQAATELKSLETRAKELKTQLIELGKANDKAGFDRAEKDLKLVNTQMRNLKKEAFDATNVLKNLNGTNFNDLRKAQSQITAELKRMERGTQDYVNKSKQLQLVEAELKKVRVEMYGVSQAGGSMWSRMADGFNRFGGIYATVSASLVGAVLGFKKLVETYNEYEKKVANLSALTGLQGEDIQWLSDQAKEMSISTTDAGIKITKGADEIVDAFTKMGSAKPELLKDKDALAAVTKEALILAAAAGMETVPAVEGLANTMNQFNAPASEASRYINVLAAGSKEGAAEIADISASIIKFGSVAGSMNVTVEQSVALIEALSEKGIKGEIAGTGLRNILLKLQTAGDDSLNPAIVGINTALENLASKNLSATEMSKLFGMENITVANILMSNTKRVNELTDAVTGTKVAYEQANKNTATNAAALEQAKNKAKLMAIELGQMLAPALTFSTNAFTYLLKGIKAIIDIYKEHSRWINSALVGVAAYTVVVYGAAAAKKAYTIATNIAAAATKAFDAMMKSNPWGLAIGAIMAVVSALILFNNKMKDSITTAKLMADINEQVQKKMVNEKFALEQLMKVAQDEAQSKENRLKAIKKLNEISPQYLGNLNLENINTIAAKNATDAYIKSLEKKYEIEALQEKLKKNMTTLVDVENEKLEDNLTYWEKIAIQAKSVFKSDQELMQEQINAAIKNKLDKKNILESENKLIEEQLKKKFEENPGIDPTGNIVPEIPTTTPSGGGGSGKNKKQELDNYLKQLYESIAKHQREIEQELLNANEREIQIIRDKYNKELEDLKINQALIDQIRFKESTGAKLTATEIAQLKVFDQVQGQMLTDIYKKREEQEKKYQETLYNVKKNAGQLTNKDIYEHDLANLTDQYNKKLIQEEEYQIRKIQIIKAYDEAELKLAEEKQKKLDEFNAKYGTGIKKEGSAGIKEKLGGLDADKKGELDQMENDAMILGITNTAQQVYNIEAKYAQLRKDLEHELFLAKLKEAEAYAQQFQAITEAAGNMVAAAKENESLEIDRINKRETKIYEGNLKRQLTAFNKEKAAEIAAAGGNKEKIEAIEKKYADRKAKMDEANQAKKEELDAQAEERKKALQKRYARIEFVVTIAKIIASTALAVMQAIAQLGPIAGGIAAGLIGITGGLQIASAKKQMDAVMQLDTGGYVNVRGASDGKDYKARYAGPTSTGYYTDPTVFLAAENKPEYVVDYNTMQQPQVINWIRAIENIRIGRQVPQFAEGGYTQDPAKLKQGAISASDPIIQMLMGMISENTTAVRNLSAKLGIPFRSFISYDDMEEAYDRMDIIDNEATFNRTS